MLFLSNAARHCSVVLRCGWHTYLCWHHAALFTSWVALPLRCAAQRPAPNYLCHAVPRFLRAHCGALLRALARCVLHTYMCPAVPRFLRAHCAALPGVRAALRTSLRLRCFAPCLYLRCAPHLSALRFVPRPLGALFVPSFWGYMQVNVSMRVPL